MLNKKEIWCNGQLIEVSEEVYKVYTQGKRKHRYLTVDLKIEEIKVDQEKQTVTVTPSREDSFDRLTDDNNVQFADEDEAVEETVIHKLMIEKLRSVLDKLSPDEYALIYALYYRGLSERQWSSETGIPQKTINNRKRRILNKLKKFLIN